MIRILADLLRDMGSDQREGKALSEPELHLVSAALMTEVMASDGSHDRAELHILADILRRDFRLEREEISELMTLAEGQVADATSLFEFTDVVNSHFDNTAKYQLIEHLWQVAHADGTVDKLEEATIRKVAELIHLPHSDFIRAKVNTR